MRAVAFHGEGGAEVMRFEERPDPVPGDDEVLVAVRYAGLNPADVLQRAGQYPAPAGSPQDVPGLEAAGLVLACGRHVRSVQEGDRVFGIVGGGGLADRVVAHERHVVATPERLSEEEAAAVPEAFITAHDAIVSQAGLRVGEVLLVNGANGGVGTAALQIGVAAGARVYGTVRSAELGSRVAELGATPLEPGMLPAAGGADVVLELVGAPNVSANLDVVAPKGRIVIVSTAAGAETPLSLAALMRKRARLIGTVLRSRPLEEKAAAVQAFGREVVPLFAGGRLRAVIDRVFRAEDAAAAFDYLAQPGKFGKVLLEF